MKKLRDYLTSDTWKEDFKKIKDSGYIRKCLVNTGLGGLTYLALSASDSFRFDDLTFIESLDNLVLIKAVVSSITGGFISGYTNDLR